MPAVGASERPGLTRGILLLFFTIFISDAIAAASGSILSPFFPRVAQQAGVTGSVIGIVFASFPASMVVAAPCSSSLIKRHGAPTIYVCGLAIVALGIYCFAAAGAALGDAGTFSVLCIIFQLLQGVGAACAESASYALIGTLAGPRLTTVLGVAELAEGGGYMAGPILGGALYSATNSFAAPMLVTASLLVACACGSVCVFVFRGGGGRTPSPPRDRGGIELLSVGGQGSIRSIRSDHGAEVDADVEEPVAFCSFIRKPQIAIVLLMCALASSTSAFLEPTLGDHAFAMGLVKDTGEVAALYAVQSAAYMLACPLAGLLADPERVGPRRVMLAGFALQPIAFLLIGPSPLLPVPTAADIMTGALNDTSADDGVCTSTTLWIWVEGDTRLDRVLSPVDKAIQLYREATPASPVPPLVTEYERAVKEYRDDKDKAASPHRRLLRLLGSIASGSPHHGSNGDLHGDLHGSSTLGSTLGSSIGSHMDTGQDRVQRLAGKIVQASSVLVSRSAAEWLDIGNSTLARDALVSGAIYTWLIGCHNASERAPECEQNSTQGAALAVANASACFNTTFAAAALDRATKEVEQCDDAKHEGRKEALDKCRRVRTSVNAERVKYRQQYIRLFHAPMFYNDIYARNLTQEELASGSVTPSDAQRACVYIALVVSGLADALSMTPALGDLLISAGHEEGAVGADAIMSAISGLATAAFAAGEVIGPLMGSILAYATSFDWAVTVWALVLLAVWVLALAFSRGGSSRWRNKPSDVDDSGASAKQRSEQHA